MILIFSVFILFNAFIPLVCYLAENIGKDPTISYEIKSMSLAQDEISNKRNVYYIILDEMTDIETAEQFNISNQFVDLVEQAQLQTLEQVASAEGWRDFIYPKQLIHLCDSEGALYYLPINIHSY